MIRAFRHGMLALGTPLLDGQCGGRAFSAMLAWLAVERPSAVALTLDQVPTGDPLFTFLEAGRHSGAPCFAVLQRWERAVLRRGAVPGLSARRRKEVARQRRRLSERGALAYVSATDREAFERFLSLENAGWKGRRGTALAARPRLAAFARQMLRDMASEGKCRVDSLLVGDSPAAMGVVLRSGSRAYFWKIAYDEGLAAHSPGVQLTLDLSRRQAADATLEWTDSCAAVDHPMIDRAWSERIGMADLMICLAGGRRCSRRFRAAVRLETLRRALRQYVKAALRPPGSLRKGLLGSARSGIGMLLGAAATSSTRMGIAVAILVAGMSTGTLAQILPETSGSTWFYSRSRLPNLDRATAPDRDDRGARARARRHGRPGSKDFDPC